ncbi:putative membrane protein [Paractinoplanes atraurantiacus]|uniref:Putative membrane protein n=1 Tax=Paractinoplanes atraurantiacus TaxID=1036182 RepID=A0A285II19_9ACTN|nr:putative membrane protein [Actinoplanes atraurantiacus]
MVVSNAMENLGVLTGVPFGHYHYTGELGPKLFEVPVLIGLAYFAVGYLAWTIGTILTGPGRRSVATPVVASFVMVAWDLAMDPSSATLRGRWVWEDGGGYFGVPLSNFLGWSVTVYLFYQLFALYLKRWGPPAGRQARLAPGCWWSSIIAYAVVAGDHVVNWVSGGHDGVPAQVTDATGRVWRSADVYEASALAALYGMGFLALLAALRLTVRGAGRRASRIAPAGTTVTNSGERASGAG